MERRIMNITIDIGSIILGLVVGVWVGIRGRK